MLNPLMTELATLIHHYRKKSGLTQQALAELAGIGKTAVFDLEQGKDTVQLNTLLSVLKVLNIKLSFLTPPEENC